MAASQDDVLNLEEIKRQLRIGGDTPESRAAFTEENEMLTDLIGQAISHIEDAIGQPVIEKTQAYFIPRWGEDTAIAISLRYIESVSEIKYWTSDGALRSNPDGTIPVADIGRNGYLLDHGGEYRKCYTIYPPADGWPEILTDSALQVSFVRGIDVAGEGKSLVAATVLIVRQLYDGFQEIRPTAAYLRLVAPFFH